jgi:predicted small integral membrane protein
MTRRTWIWTARQFLAVDTMAAMATNSTEAKSPSWFSALGTLPFAALVMVTINMVYILLVSIGNITDFGTNQEFVQHVLAMDTTNFGQPAGQGLDPDVMWRAITNTTVQNTAYIAMIIWESTTAAILIWAVVTWIRSLGSRNYDAARRLATTGLLMILILFMGGFITIGGEWFQMWRSVAWNGLDPAFRNSVLAAFGIVLIHLPSRQWHDGFAGSLDGS